MKTINTRLVRGGEFLVRGDEADMVFTPEDFTEDHLLLRQSVRDFIEREIEPRREDLDGPEGYKVSPRLLEKMGEMGFLGIGVPETFGGYEADFKTQLTFSELAYSTWSFGLTVGIQTSLGVAPLLLYGNQEQKEKYLPGIVSGELKSCYCLTEPGAGSDANSGKSRAELSAEGTHYVLNGQKMWITSSGHADLFIVFAKIEDDKYLSCLLVEKDFGGIRLGAEEKKMGIRGSSTRQVFFENVLVPVENLLGRRGGGFTIALNVLNTGRIKLASSTSGNAKRAFQYSLDYARERVQFGQPIVRFGAIQQKLGEMAARIYAMESVIYRIGGAIDHMNEEIVQEGIDPLEAKWRSIAAFAIECAIAKVHNTEGVAFVADEGVQIHGGMGFSAETPIETLYRNVRVDRIYEGTNEINRLLIIDLMMRKIERGELPIIQALRELHRDSGWIPQPEDPLDSEHALLHWLKHACLLLLGTAVEELGERLKSEQEIALGLADCLIHTYVLDTVLLRAEKAKSSKRAGLHLALARLIAYRAAQKVDRAGRSVAANMPDNYARLRTALVQLCSYHTEAPKDLHQQVVEAALATGGYPFKF